MARGRRKARQRTRTKGMVIVLTVLVVTGAAGVAWAWVGPDLGRPEGGSLTPAADVRTAPPPTVKSGEAPADAAEDAAEKAAAESLRTCVDADDKGAKAVEAARNSVGDWAAHIRAMDDLEAGVHSEEHTKSVWGVTRLRGPDRLSRFLSADKEYQEARDACAEVKQTEMSAGQRAALDDCQDVGQQIDTALSSADDALDEWRSHLKNMADRRAGSLDPDVAMTRWLAAYEKAPTNIKAFEAAEKAYSDTSVECTADGA